jgi:hypothetical protein
MSGPPASRKSLHPYDLHPGSPRPHAATAGKSPSNSGPAVSMRCHRTPKRTERSESHAKASVFHLCNTPCRVSG